MGIALPKIPGGGLHVNIVYVACVIRVAGDGIEQRGAQDIADLEAGVVVAVAEGRQEVRGLPLRR